MEPPPVQYTRTQDGFDIAYMACGDGLPLVLMPWPYSNISQMWKMPQNRPMLEGLAERFRLVQYDSRGQGMSTRGLPESHSMADYELDLEAVTGRLGLSRFVLIAGPLFDHVAVQYAARQPDRVAALVLSGGMVRHSGGPWELIDLARRDWDSYLHVASSAYGAGTGMYSHWREAITQADFLTMLRVAAESDITAALPAVMAPTLIMNVKRMGKEGPQWRGPDEGHLLASLIPNARMILYDAYPNTWYSEGSGPPPGVLAVEEFVRELGLTQAYEASPGTTRPSAPSAALSPREAEVLRLIAAGRSNQQIADELVLSVRTVERHITNLYSKIGAHGKADATAYALRSGIA